MTLPPWRQADLEHKTDESDRRSRGNARDIIALRDGVRRVEGGEQLLRDEVERLKAEVRKLTQTVEDLRLEVRECRDSMISS